MTIPPPAPSAEAARPYFARLRELRDRLATQSGYALSELSMGMTDDFEVAIEEGATIVRIGRAVFGERPREHSKMKKLGFIGGGNMAEALAHGLIQHKVFKPGDIIVSDVAPDRRRKLARALKVATTDDNAEVCASPPRCCSPSSRRRSTHVMTELAAELAKASKKTAGKGKLFISIAAGITIERLTRGPRASARE